MKMDKGRKISMTKIEALEKLEKAVNIFDWIFVGMVVLSIFRDTISNLLLDAVNVDWATNYILISDGLLRVSGILWGVSSTLYWVARGLG